MIAPGDRGHRSRSVSGIVRSQMLRFGTRSILLATVMFAIAVPAFFIPGGMYFYLPLLFVFFLSVTFAALLLKWLKTPSRGPIAKQIPLLLVAVSLLLSIVAFAMLFDVAIDRFETVRFNTTQRRAALTIADPESFRDVVSKSRPTKLAIGKT